MTRSVIQIRLTHEQRIQLDDDRGETPLSEYVRGKLGLMGATSPEPPKAPREPRREPGTPDREEWVAAKTVPLARSLGGRRGRAQAERLYDEYWPS